MKIIFASLITFMSLSGFAMDFESFEDNCPKQMAMIEKIDARIEALPDSEENHAIGGVIMSSIQGFIFNADKCEWLNDDLPKVQIVMKKLKIK